MKAVITYGALLLSSFVINGLSSGTDYAYILKVTVGTAILLSGAASIDYFIDKHLEMAMNVMETQYMALQQEKIMNLDYALIDSPRLKEIRERMRLERNWGAGIYSMFWQEKNFSYPSAETCCCIDFCYFHNCNISKERCRQKASVSFCFYLQL